MFIIVKIEAHPFNSSGKVLWLCSKRGSLERVQLLFHNFFILKKHIKSAGQTYTSASGRGKIIRNVEKYRSLPFSAAIYSDSDGIQRLCTLGKPYLEKIESAAAKEELFKIIKEANSRRKPNSPPLFKPKTLDWHWEMIEKLGKVGDALLESHNMK